ncbi:hypothetical protein QVD17_32545 [Tagetes erecta]|uniref:Uncharacterized protein n=1 Tax=Tagetes erecta TaxID=13708 RepID=A0AAD8JVU8_TARER|nr:hypothetical protein QVD17_32545 [Tagetes erecta]
MAINDFVRDTKSTQYFTMHDHDTYLDEERDQSEMDDHITGALKECLEEVGPKVKDLFKKIVSNEHVDMPLGRLAREAIGEAGAKEFLGKIVTKVSNKLKAQKDEDFVVGNRGLSIDDELSQKLERFKVKTLNIGGIVKQENNR